jgi:hypothetical protein
MPFVRNIVTQWQPRNCDPMVDFLDSWAHIIPVWVLDNILDQLIFPKLQKEVGRGGDRLPTPGCCEASGAGGSVSMVPSHLPEATGSGLPGTSQASQGSSQPWHRL